MQEKWDEKLINEGNGESIINLRLWVYFMWWNHHEDNKQLKKCIHGSASENSRPKTFQQPRSTLQLMRTTKRVEVNQSISMMSYEQFQSDKKKISKTISMKSNVKIEWKA